ncbi:MAG: SDR family NAD(P)-dependent oxidoreductase [Verrucomicrobiaceae bacterium]|nr:MAG: SDR family NAD(P)-dependent oxidoreductase [Verrucomicrobiaceae bacterium]
MIFANGQVAVITGASSGVGKAIATALAIEGASLALVGRDLGALQHTAPDGPGTIRCYEADLTDDAELVRFTSQVLADFGRVDILVHSAGVFSMGPLETAPLESFDLQYRCNVRAPFALTQALLGSLVEHKGQIVFINSTAGLSAGAGVSQYAATKHALKAVADSLRQEINPKGVRVLSVFLGRTATPMQESICKQEGKPYDPSYFIQPADVAASLLHTLGLPRNAEIIDLTIRPMKPLPRA